MPLLGLVKKLNLSSSSKNQITQKSVIKRHLTPSVKINTQSASEPLPDLGTATGRHALSSFLNKKAKNRECPHIPQTP